MKIEPILRKHPTFEEVANIVNEDAAVIKLPARTFLTFRENINPDFQNFTIESLQNQAAANDF